MELEYERVFWYLGSGDYWTYITLEIQYNDLWLTCLFSVLILNAVMDNLHSVLNKSVQNALIFKKSEIPSLLFAILRKSRILILICFGYCILKNFSAVWWLPVLIQMPRCNHGRLCVCVSGARTEKLL